MTKDKKNAELLKDCFTLVFASDTSCSPRVQLSELEDRDEKQNAVSITQEEMTNDLLCYLDVYKSMGMDVIHPSILKELADVLTRSLHHYLSPVQANRRGSS